MANEMIEWRILFSELVYSLTIINGENESVVLKYGASIYSLQQKYQLRFNRGHNQKQWEASAQEIRCEWQEMWAYIHNNINV